MNPQTAVDDIRSELFPKDVLDPTYSPDGRKGTTGFLRVLRYVPPTAGRFEEMIIWSRMNDRDPVDKWNRMRTHEQVDLAKSQNGYRILSDQEAEIVVIQERRRRALWAMLSDHLFEIEQHDLQAIQTELNLTDDQMRTAKGVAKSVKRLVGKVSHEDLKVATAALREFNETYSKADVRDSLRLSKRQEELKATINEIQTGQKTLKRIQKEHPLMFQTPEERARLNSQEDFSLKAPSHDDPRTTDTDAPQTSAPAGRSRKGAAG